MFRPQDGLVGAPYPAAGYSLGVDVRRFELEDIDGDGTVDVLASGTISSTTAVGILFGVADGTFETGVTLEVGPGGPHGASFDLDGDGDRDVVACSEGTGEVFLFENLGGRSFAPRVLLGTQEDAYFVAFADANGDGMRDVLVASSSTTRIAVFLRDSAGGLSRAQDLFMFGGAERLFVTDINLDGLDDLVVTGNISDFFQVILGGPMGLGFPTFYRSDFRLVKAQIRDGNGDGFPDIVGVEWAEDNIVLLPGLGDGTFGPAIRAATGPNPVNVEVGDLDGDSVVDFLVSRSQSSGASGVRTEVVMGDPIAVFGGTGPQVLVGFSPLSSAIRDFDGDGMADIGALAGAGGWTVVRGLGNGLLEWDVRTEVGVDAEEVFAGDFDGDGSEDLVVLDGSIRAISTYRHAGGGEFVPIAVTPVGSNLRNAVPGDLDLDGDLDLLLAADIFGSMNLIPYLNDGSGAFVGAPAPVATSVDARYLQMGDLDGDGDLDAVYTESFGRLLTMLGQGDGTFLAPVDLDPFAEARDLDLGDVDGDGDLDIVTVNGGDRGLRLYRGTGTGFFIPEPAQDTGLGSNASTVTLGDFDGDGALDAAVSGTTNGGQDKELLVMRGAGDGSFAPGSPGPFTSLTQSLIRLRAVDLNLDGRADLVGLREGTFRDTPEIRYGQMDGSLGSGSYYVGAAAAGGFALTDLNQDGNDDLVVTRPDERALVALLHRAGGRLDRYCDQNQNSTGAAATIGWDGSRRLSGPGFTLRAAGMPVGETSVWFAGVLSGFRPLGAGTLCIGGALTRASLPGTVDAAGTTSLDVVAAGLPLLPGSTWFFQAWFTDPSGAAPQFSFSEALAVRFLP